MDMESEVRVPLAAPWQTITHPDLASHPLRILMVSELHYGIADAMKKIEKGTKGLTRLSRAAGITILCTFVFCMFSINIDRQVERDMSQKNSSPAQSSSNSTSSQGSSNATTSSLPSTPPVAGPVMVAKEAPPAQRALLPALLHLVKGKRKNNFYLFNVLSRLPHRTQCKSSVAV